MKPRRTHESNHVFRLRGGTEDNDLWTCLALTPDDTPLVCSVWVPSDEERAQIAAGANVELRVVGTQQPPVYMVVTNVELGRSPVDPPAIPEVFFK